MPRRMEIPNLDDLLRRYQAGESENKLAKEAGVNRWTFRRRLEEAGIEPRGKSEAERLKWAQMSPEQRRHQVSAAHEAARGRRVSRAELIARAKAREGSTSYNVSDEEIVLGDRLREIGLKPIHNLAVGPYNCDLGVGSVVVEIWGGGWHPKPGETERTKYILDAGYSVLIVDTDQRRYPLSREVTDHFIDVYEFTRRNKSSERQYRMVRGNGDVVFLRFNSDEISLEPPFTSSRDPSNGQYIRVPD